MAVPECSVLSNRQENMKKLQAKGKNRKRVLVVSQDLQLVKALAGNNKKIRDKALKSLKKWLKHRSISMPFTEGDFMRLWKGLFYSMWMSDKPLVQEECAENISRLVHLFELDTALQFFKCAQRTLMNEWFGIDQLRLDKFMMLARRILRQCLEVLKQNEWSVSCVDRFNEILSETILSIAEGPSLGATTHFIEIYLEEFAKVSEGDIEPSLMTSFLEPFAKQLVVAKDDRQMSHIMKFVFRYLMHQSDAAMEYQEKFAAWKKLGYPGGSIDSMEKQVSGGDENVMLKDNNDSKRKLQGHNATERPLDPRAGRVDVVLPQIPFSPSEISKLLSDLKFIPGSSTRSRRAVSKLVKEYDLLSGGTFPLGIKQMRLPEDDGYSTNLRKSVNRLIKFENKLYGKRNPRKRKRNEDTSGDPGIPSKKLRESAELKNHDTKSNRDFKSRLEEFVKKSEGEITAGTINVARKTMRQESESVNVKSKKTSDCERKTRYGEVIKKLNPADRAYLGMLKVVEKRKILKRKAIGKLKLELPSLKYENSFVRNSGIWHVHRIRSDVEEQPKVPNGSVQSSSSKTKSKVPLSRSTPQCLETNGILIRSNSIESGQEIRKARKRHSFDSVMVKNPFCGENSAKKVKIDLKLNKSQEIHEHHAQLRSSPGIPFDANKKPLKPLLKPNAIGSPINPFYKRKLKL